jgi:branched-subunit amino acid aminotransferase/4-amino-4-deoxychorismate lyase
MSFSLISTTKYDDFLATLGWNCSHYFLLEYHHNRIVDAADKHGWKDAKQALTLEALQAECHKVVTEYHGSHPDSAQTLKVYISDSTIHPSHCFPQIRLALSMSGVLTATASPAQPFTSDPTAASFFNPTTDNPSLCGPVLTVFVDSQPTPTSLFTSTKTTHRSIYDDARSRAGLLPVGAPDPPGSATPYPADVLLYNTENKVTETTIYNVAFYHAPHWITPPASTGCLPGVLRRWLLEQGRIREAEESVLTKESVADRDWVLLFNGVQGCRLGRITLC